MAARIEGLPERQAKISARAEGRVAEIMVKLGDRVTTGQPLLRFDPLAVGNPPVLLKAPIDGFVVRQDASIGQALRPDTVLMEVADYSQVLARATTFESPDLSLIKVGDPARVTPELSALRAQLLANLAAAATEERPLALAGATPNVQSARLHIVGKRPDGSRVVADAAFFVKGLTLYQATVLGSDDAPGREAVETFFGAIRLP